MENNICCFSGHRRIPREAQAPLRALLGSVVRELAEAGTTAFLCGGALGFDTLAAEVVLEERLRLPGLTLSLALPTPDQSSRWSERDKQRYDRIRREADEVLVLSPRYSPYCMQKRNRYMVDHSGLLVCYMTEAEGGTVFTVNYALGKGVAVRNLAMEL